MTRTVKLAAVLVAAFVWLVAGAAFAGAVPCAPGHHNLPTIGMRTVNPAHSFGHEHSSHVSAMGVAPRMHQAGTAAAAAVVVDTSPNALACCTGGGHPAVTGVASFVPQPDPDGAGTDATHSSGIAAPVCVPTAYACPHRCLSLAQLSVLRA